MITFVTGNKNKLLETRAIVGGEFDIQSTDFDCPEIQGTTQEVAIAKCKAAAVFVNGPVMTEDTALCFNALNGLPGPYIKHFLESVHLSGLLQMLDGFEDKSGYALCTFAYSSGPGGDVVLFEGRTDGCIVEARGATNFGWDPIFQPIGGELTYAEMTKESKNAISHRYRSLEKLKSYLKQLN